MVNDRSFLFLFASIFEHAESPRITRLIVKRYELPLHDESNGSSMSAATSMRPRLKNIAPEIAARAASPTRSRGSAVRLRIKPEKIGSR